MSARGRTGHCCVRRLSAEADAQRLVPVRAKSPLDRRGRHGLLAIAGDDRKWARQVEKVALDQPVSRDDGPVRSSADAYSARRRGARAHGGNRADDHAQSHDAASESANSLGPHRAHRLRDPLAAGALMALEADVRADWAMRSALLTDSRRRPRLAKWRCDAFADVSSDSQSPRQCNSCQSERGRKTRDGLGVVARCVLSASLHCAVDACSKLLRLPGNRPLAHLGANFALDQNEWGQGSFGVEGQAACGEGAHDDTASKAG